jgi:hypothetical protein
MAPGMPWSYGGSKPPVPATRNSLHGAESLGVVCKSCVVSDRLGVSKVNDVAAVRRRQGTGIGSFGLGPAEADVKRRWGTCCDSCRGGVQPGRVVATPPEEASVRRRLELCA